MAQLTKAQLIIEHKNKVKALEETVTKLSETVGQLEEFITELKSQLHQEKSKVSGLDRVLTETRKKLETRTTDLSRARGYIDRVLEQEADNQPTQLAPLDPYNPVQSTELGPKLSGET